MKRRHRIEVRGISRAELEAIAGPVDFPIVTYAAYLHRPPSRGGPALIAFGGLCWRLRDANGPRCDIWLDVPDRRRMKSLARSHSLTLVRWARTMLNKAAQLGEGAVFCIRDDEENSAKLLRLTGLQYLRTDVIRFDTGEASEREIWWWSNSPTSG